MVVPSNRSTTRPSTSVVVVVFHYLCYSWSVSSFLEELYRDFLLT